ncbi:MAG: calcium-binding protein P [Bacteroidales bacterium]|nr:calcium-binding protein P [Bacteroidales bacterium]
MKRLAYLFLMLVSCPFIAVMLTACNEEEDCSKTERQMMWCGIYTYINEESNKVINDTIPADSLTITAWDTDSIIVNREKKVSQLDLPLRYAEDSTVFVFEYSETEKDTLVVKHKNKSYFISMDCGYQTQHTITDVYFMGSVLDSVYLKKNEANNNGAENIKLFYRP